ncbi:MAG: glycosyltransferase family 87 protein [Nitrospirota bacterium]
MPYLPLYAWLFTPFTLPSPPIGFAIWDGLNLLAGCYLVWQAAQMFPKIEQAYGTLLILVSFPLVYCLYVGQPMILMACAVAACYRSLRLGQDFTAGLWTACLLFKPNYGLVLGLLLIYKGRWRAVAGAVAGGVIVVGGSILVAGLPTVLAYPASLQEHAKFRSGSEEDMVNWLSIILDLRPGIGDFKGMLLEQFLNAVTILGVAFAWRGPWKPRAPNFPIQFTLVILATLIANHHSFNYGAVLLAVPLASALAERQLSRFSHVTVIAGIVLPTLSFTITTFIDPSQASRILAYLLLVCLMSLFAELWWRDRQMGKSPLNAPA